MSTVREAFATRLMAANASLICGGAVLGGFLAKTSGAISVTDAANNLLVDAVPVTAGIYTPIPIQFQQAGGYTVALSGGASGTLFL